MPKYAKKSYAKKPYAKKQLVARKKPFNLRQLYGKPHARVPIIFNPCQLGVHNVVPPRFFTQLEYGFTGACNQAAVSSYRWSILGNSLVTPGNTSQAFTSIGTLYPATHNLSVLQPVGITAMKNLWQSYRVVQSHVTFTVCPQNGANGVCQAILFPTTTEEAVNDPQLTMSLPYSKAIVTIQGGAVKENTIIKSMDVQTMFGISRQQLMADPGYSSLVGVQPANLFWWTFDVNNITGSAGDTSATQVPIQVRITYDVEFYDPYNSEIDT